MSLAEVVATWRDGKQVLRDEPRSDATERIAFFKKTNYLVRAVAAGATTFSEETKRDDLTPEEKKNLRYLLDVPSVRVPYDATHHRVDVPDDWHFQELLWHRHGAKGHLAELEHQTHQHSKKAFVVAITGALGLAAGVLPGVAAIGSATAGAVLVHHLASEQRYANRHRNQVAAQLDELISNSDPELFQNHNNDARQALSIANIYLGQSALVRGDIDDSLTHAQQAVFYQPTSPAAHRNYLAASLEQPSLPRAVRELRLLFPGKPTDERDAFFTMSYAYKHRNKLTANDMLKLKWSLLTRTKLSFAQQDSIFLHAMRVSLGPYKSAMERLTHEYEEFVSKPAYKLAETIVLKSDLPQHTS